MEIYHAGHNLIETRAPIRAMSFTSWGGRPYLVAAYTCTPLVTIPLDDLKDGAHIRGKTVAELGYGGVPARNVYATLRACLCWRLREQHQPARLHLPGDCAGRFHLTVRTGTPSAA